MNNDNEAEKKKIMEKSECEKIAENSMMLWKKERKTFEKAFFLKIFNDFRTGLLQICGFNLATVSHMIFFLFFVRKTCYCKYIYWLCNLFLGVHLRHKSKKNLFLYKMFRFRQTCRFPNK